MEQAVAIPKDARKGEFPQQFVDCNLGDDVWYVMIARTRRGLFWNRVHLDGGEFLTAPEHANLLQAAKQFIVLAASTPIGRKNRPLKGGALIALFNSLRGLLCWLAVRGIRRFRDITIDHVVSYRVHIEAMTTVVNHKSGLMPPGTRKPLARHTKFGKIQPLLYLSRLQHVMEPDGTRLKAYEVADVFASITGDAKSEKATERIPDDLFRQLILTAISFLNEPGFASLIERVESFESDWKRHDTRIGRDTRIMTPAARRLNFYFTKWRPQNQMQAAVAIRGTHYDTSRFTLGEFKNLFLVLRGACLTIIAGLVGMRLSELRTLGIGCLRPLRLDDGRVLLRIHGTLFKTADDVEGEPAEWVAGWDEPGNPVREAVEMLERLAHAERVTVLFPRLHARGRGEDKSVSPGMMGQFVRRFAAFANVGGEWPFAMHQFRKTFARFVALSDVNATLALMRHFKHVSILMTERYLPNDLDLIGEIIEASEALIAERLETVFGAERLSGYKGQEILMNNVAYRGDAHIEERRELVAMTLGDPSVRVLLHIYGICIYDEPTAKCKGDFANIGMWTCVDCKNSVIDESVAPFWEEQVSRLGDAIALREQLGFIDLDLMKQRDRAIEVLEDIRRGDRQTA